MNKNNKRLIVVGDRVLVHVQEGEERTKVGLYLPPTAMDSQAVQGGKIVATGPGLPMPDPGESGDESWRTPLRETRFIPMQARAGDYALFFRKAAVEITFEAPESSPAVAGDPDKVRQVLANLLDNAVK